MRHIPLRDISRRRFVLHRTIPKKICKNSATYTDRQGENRVNSLYLDISPPVKLHTAMSTATDLKPDLLFRLLVTGTLLAGLSSFSLLTNPELSLQPDTLQTVAFQDVTVTIDEQDAAAGRVRILRQGTELFQASCQGVIQSVCSADTRALPPIHAPWIRGVETRPGHGLLLDGELSDDFNTLYYFENTIVHEQLYNLRQSARTEVAIPITLSLLCWILACIRRKIVDDRLRHPSPPVTELTL